MLLAGINCTLASLTLTCVGFVWQHLEMLWVNAKGLVAQMVYGLAEGDRASKGFPGASVDPVGSLATIAVDPDLSVSVVLLSKPYPAIGDWINNAVSD